MTGTGTMCVDAKLQSPLATSAAEHDRRQKAKAANDESSEASAQEEGGDMFSQAGIAAE